MSKVLGRPSVVPTDTLADPSQAGSREEKRWMIRQNQSERKKQKKAENSRMIKLIDNIFACDPRIRK
jgi:DnaJ family protein C protein 2